jgi:Spy/CpxP family protein refolding chaperone
MNEALKWKLAFAFLLVFIAGVTTGCLFGALHLRKRHLMGPPHSGDVAGKMREHFRKALDLTAEQEAQILPIIDKTSTRLESIRVETAERVRSVMEESKRQIAPQLSPEQQKKLEKLEAHHRKVMLHHGFHHRPLTEKEKENPPP